jgi:hypothetical protein
MEIASIKGDTVLLLYHPAETAANVGEQFAVRELPDRTEGLVVQVISNDSLDYAGLQQEMIQRILEQRISEVQHLLDNEEGMGEIKSLKLAAGKIRKRIQGGDWKNWDGWIPTRNVEISRIQAEELMAQILPQPDVPLRQFARFDATPVELNGPALNMVSVITGVKGSGKSHLAKHVLLALGALGIPCVVFDINGEYIDLPGVQVLRWGQNYLPDLAASGFEMLENLVRTIYPLSPGSPSEAIFESQLPEIFNNKKTACARQNVPFVIDIAELRAATWRGGSFVQDAIDHRLSLIESMNLFLTNKQRGTAGLVTSLNSAYDTAADGSPIVFDMRDMSRSRQTALVNSVNRLITNICQVESRGHGRYPFVFFEEAHFYVSESTIMDIITRGRHIGMASIFVTNTPERLPDAVFRQLDNLFLLALTHRDDIRNVSKNSFTDQETIESFATRMPERHALLVGNVTDRYPLVLEIDPLPSDVPPTGRTRSTWDRFLASADGVSSTNNEGIEDIRLDDDWVEEPPF